ncbi:hypothetical protein G7078_09250 [Sphingomonas sinipercae]|uniref:DUF2231 domain-containing protein n=1 Tax=Sphingomonas sinipercae TaxID=2714944 RepID=A0A6G7ZPW5_9SPHN|nr:DUF2231 domain-containing protein [Sphingomonas sinipercae]QIL02946.1 hypothetical protein G7078_09250 [Sphingomonas sinipercae]
MAPIHARNLHPIHPFHAFLLAGSAPLLVGALLADWAYSSSFELQWKNFASWLLVGGLVLSGFVLLWAVVDLLRTGLPGRSGLLYPGLLLATWVIGLIDALEHAKDAWASMPAALILSLVVAILAALSAWLGLRTFNREVWP